MIIGGFMDSTGILFGNSGMAKSLIFSSNSRIVAYGGTEAVNVFAATCPTHSQAKRNPHDPSKLRKFNELIVANHDKRVYVHPGCFSPF